MSITSRHGWRRKQLTEEQILGWVDAFFARRGRWPCRTDGRIPGARGTKWANVDAALIHGIRGLPGGSSLAQFLATHRGHRNIKRLPPLTEAIILVWADAFHRRTGRWPSLDDGAIPDSGGESWINVDAALKDGHRGLPGGSSLARLLADHRGMRNRLSLPRLTQTKILDWADDHFRRTGRWPRRDGGVITAAPDETWMKVDYALSAGARGLPGGTSLARLLAAKRGVPNPLGLPPLTEAQIMAWADAHYRRTGRWPGAHSGMIRGSRPPQTWNAINCALQAGCRGLPGGTTLSRFLRPRGRGS